MRCVFDDDNGGTPGGAELLPRGRENGAEAFAEGLPIKEVIPDIVRALEAGMGVVLQAPPGAGKTTAVPLALLLESPSWLPPSSAIWVRHSPLSPLTGTPDPRNLSRSSLLL